MAELSCGCSGSRRCKEGEQLWKKVAVNLGDYSEEAEKAYQKALAKYKKHMGSEEQ